MWDQDLVTLLRGGQLAVLVLTLTILGARVNKWWCHKWRCLLPAAGTGLVATLIGLGTLDAMVTERPGGVQSLVILLASVALLMQALTVGLGRGSDHATHLAAMDIKPPRQERSGPVC